MEIELTNSADQSAAGDSLTPNWFITYTQDKAGQPPQANETGRGKLHFYESTRRIIIDPMPTDSLAALASWMSVPRRKALVDYTIVKNETNFALAQLVQLNLEFR